MLISKHVPYKPNLKTPPFVKTSQNTINPIENRPDQAGLLPTVEIQLSPHSVVELSCFNHEQYNNTETIITASSKDFPQEEE